MNLNVKRLSNPLKGKCRHNAELIETISALTNNKADLRMYNKDRSIKTLGNAIENASINCDCNKKNALKYARQIAFNTLDPNNSLTIHQDILTNGGFCLEVDVSTGKILIIHYIKIDSIQSKRIDISDGTTSGEAVFNAFTYPPTDEAVKMLQDFDTAGGMGLGDIGVDLLTHTGTNRVNIISYIFTNTD